MQGFLFDLGAWIFTIIVMLLIEPLLISILGTTPAKKILGLKLKSIDGGKISYTKALSRTFSMLSVGEGFRLPIYSLYKNYKCKKSLENNEKLQWDEEFYYTAEKNSFYRWIIFFMLLGALFAFTTSSVIYAGSAIHKGSITVEQFADNFNHNTDFYLDGYSNHMNENGELKEKESYQDEIVIDFFGVDEGKFSYDLNNGEIRSLTYTVEGESDVWVTFPVLMLNISVMSYGENEFTFIFDNKEIEALSYLDYSQDFVFETENCVITYDIETSNMKSFGNDFLSPVDDLNTDEKAEYKIEFNIKKKN